MVSSRRDVITGRPLAHSYIAGFRASLHGCAQLRRVYDRPQGLWEDWPGARRRRGDPCRYRVDDGAEARRCGWGWDQPWGRRRAWARSLRAWVRAREPLLL